MSHQTLPKVGVGAVVWRGHEVLLVRRAKAPRLGEWSLPAGTQELGETLAECAVREVQEETGIEIDLLGLIDVVDLIERDADGTVLFHYTIVDFSARWRSGEARAGSDATSVAWVPLEKIEAYRLWEETASMILKSARLHGPLAKWPRETL